MSNDRIEAKPVRIQRKRTKGWRMPPNTVCVTRPGKWGNPFKVGQSWRDGEGVVIEIKTTEDAVGMYETYVRAMLLRDKNALAPLRGKNLACFCSLDKPCHADVLLEIANAE